MRQPPPVLYRYFDVEQYADAFCEGTVMISTLGRCRAIEDLARRDPGEGNGSYVIENLVVSPDDPASQAAAAQGGFDIRGGRAQIIGCMSIRAWADAYVLCFSESLSDDMLKKMGAFVVEISPPVEFFRHLTDALAEAVEIEGGEPGAVGYRDRVTFAPDVRPSDDRFIKPQLFEEEMEHRFVWVPSPPHRSIAPVLVAEPSLKSFCRRVR
jgi:hypothetical protein